MDRRKTGMKRLMFGRLVPLLWSGILCGASLAILLPASPAHAQWEPEVRLTYSGVASLSNNNNAWCVAASGSNVHVVWSDFRNRRWGDDIYTKRSTDSGVSWGPDTQIMFADDTLEFKNPSVAVSGSNVHVVSWQRFWIEIYAKRSTDSGVSWGPDTRLATNRTVRSLTPSVAASGSNVHVVWHDSTAGNEEIYAKRSTDSGVSWGPDARLTNNSAGSLYPSVAVSGSNVHVVWEDYRNGLWNPEIYAKRSTDSGVSWGQDTRLTNYIDRSVKPSVAASGSNVHVVWEDFRNANMEIYTKRSTDSGASWGMDTRLTYNSPNGAWSGWSSVAASGSNVHVVWVDGRDAWDNEIYYKLSTDFGVSWGPDTRLTYTSEYS
jgi:hypothetical protein